MSARPLLGPDHNLVLIGQRCSGKTTLGRQLAGLLGRPFLDADEELARTCGRSADQLLAEQGEAAFRTAEVAVLEALARRRGHVLATGGGVVLHPGALAALAASGVVVYLDVPLDERLRRQTAAPRARLREGDLAEELAALHAERDGLYRAAADIVLNPEGPHSILAGLETRPTGPAAP